MKHFIAVLYKLRLKLNPTTLLKTTLKTKHLMLACFMVSQRRIDLSYFADDNSYHVLNDKSATHSFYSCRFGEVLTLASSDIDSERN